MADYKSREEKRNAQKASKKTSKKTTKKKKGSIFKKIIITVLIVGLAGLLFGGGLFAYYASQAPELNEEDFVDPITTEILDVNGDVFARIGAENREFVDYNEIPPLVENAVLAIEDNRFYEHQGVDFLRLMGAVLANITEGFGAEGASTLTQQVIKQSVLTPEKSLERKAQEAWLAYQLEQDYSKEDIFEMYVNKIFYSDGIYGIRTASEYYFDADLSELQVHQAAYLAGLPQRPNAYNVYENPDLAKERRDIVLRQMHNHGKISEEEMSQAIETDIMDGVVDRSEESGNPRQQLSAEESKYDAFVDVVLDEIEDLDDVNPYEDGLKINTTLDPNAQTVVENTLNDGSIQFPADMDGVMAQAGVTLLDTESGAIRAIGGGRGYGDEVKRGFNYATDQTRQPGSAIKPLLDYAPAIEFLEWSTAQTIVDEPYEYSNGFAPNNYDGQFKGPMTMREALADSRNITAIKAYMEVGQEQGTEFLRELGWDFEADNCGGVLCESAAIGGEPETNTLEMAGAYAAFGNKGVYNEPHSITSIEFRDGSSMNLEAESDVAMKDSTAYMMSDMLKDVLEPGSTGELAQVNGLPMAGKSGTTNYTAEQLSAGNIPSNGAPDSWFAGYTTQYTAAVWLGYEENQAENYLSPQDRWVSQYIFRDIMRGVHEGIETPDFEKPESVVEVEIEKGTSPVQLASEYTPADQKSVELFIRGTEPTSVSEEFVVPDLQSPSNLSAEYNEENGTIQLTWDHNQDENDNRDVEFEVLVSIDGGEESELAVTSQNGLNIEQVQEGSSYTFTVTAIADEERSSSANTNIEIVRSEDEAQEDEETEEDEEQQNEDVTEENTDENQGDQNSEEENTESSEEEAEPNNGEGNNNGNGGGNSNEDSGQTEENTGDENQDEPAEGASDNTTDEGSGE
ncbi:PBP1A family penicillin-binding protein [Jeotgalibacillus salarius]|uniref:PBP1A family penicillin-binding protein n=1 Tax=Jeotgalibacillus salarius TaxID=546023 RepID=A0A4Y8LKF9_9BACL|nr:PBP1A family penicillin-binding protein [Jeotgalibacillus salarius]TFE03052.1 PBP1A family penicillin-binding protein [Jeotgalibacillus salarius]